ncbi:MAG: 3-isopropylmalate dehydratase large subunit [Fimbriimonadales bacterium]
MGMTFAEKVLARASGHDAVVPGQVVTVRPDHLLTHDNTAPIIKKVENELLKYGVCDPELPIIVLDHVSPAANEKAAAQHKAVREFVKSQGIRHFYDVGMGICHQLVMEEGLAGPGKLIVGSDSHTCTYGAIGAFSTGIDRTEAACLLLTGETWLRVPHSIKITLSGRLRPPVAAKDLMLAIIREMGADGANYCSVEFHGAVDGLTMDDRIAICNMAVEMGAKNAAFPVDEIALEYMSGHRATGEPLWADADAKYVAEYSFDLDSLVPLVAIPHRVDNVRPAAELGDVAIHQAFLGTCTNGRLSDLHEAARILKGRRISPDCRMLTVPASKKVLDEALADGTIAVLSAAGSLILPSGCGPCMGAHQGVLAPGEACISTANRNFRGRMGCVEADIYLASPATVAASAIHGRITDPREEYEA